MSIADKLKQISDNVPKVFEAGKTSEYDAFWDAFQFDTTSSKPRTQYNYAFYQIGWSDINYKPKYVPEINYAVGMFSYNNVTDTLVPFDFTKLLATSSNVFAKSKKLKTIRKIIVNETVSFGGWFTESDALENVEFDGIIGQDLDLHWSTKLSKESIQNIIEHLSGEASGKTVTFSRTAVENVFSNKLSIPFGFTIGGGGANLTFLDNGNGTVTVNGSLDQDYMFDFGEAIGTFPAGTYSIYFPSFSRGYVDVMCFDLDGNRLTVDRSIVGVDGSILFTTDIDFVIKSHVYLQANNYIDEVIAFPTISNYNTKTPFTEFASVVNDKSNWTISLM